MTSVQKTPYPDDLDTSARRRRWRRKHRGEHVRVNAEAVTWSWAWQVRCPRCGFKLSGDGSRSPGERIARCGSCKRVLVLAHSGRRAAES